MPLVKEPTSSVTRSPLKCFGRELRYLRSANFSAIARKMRDLVSRHRVRLVCPELALAQGDFHVFVYLGDEKALHVHDARILKPGFSVVSSEYVVGLLSPRHVWMVPEEGSARTADPVRQVATSS